MSGMHGIFRLLKFLYFYFQCIYLEMCLRGRSAFQSKFRIVTTIRPKLTDDGTPIKDFIVRL